MATTGKRDNEYWLQRLEKDGHKPLLEQVKAGQVTVYRATQLAGYRPKEKSATSAKLCHHWKRASAEERKHFVIAHLKDLNRVMHDVRNTLLEAKAKKTRLPE